MIKKANAPDTPKLSRELIIHTALEMIDQSGAQGLSMRSLGQQLNVEAMALYRHVHGKEDLLEGVVALLMADLTDTLEKESGQHWQPFLQAVAHGVRRIATEHPFAFPLVATRHPAAPWLRPPLRSIQVVNTFLTALIGQGFTTRRPSAPTDHSAASYLGSCFWRQPSAVHGPGPVSYTHLTLPTNREV